MIVVLEFALAIGGFMSGMALLTAPDGANLGWSTTSLAGSPFNDYWIPALLLLTFNGIFPLIVATAALRQRPWATWGHLVIGTCVVGWIGIQLLLFGYLSLLQPIFGALGFIVAALSLVVIAARRNGLS